MRTVYLQHHGIKGQKWGVRRYQNEDGSLTAAGRKHVGVGDTSHDGELKNKQTGRKAGGIKDYFEKKKQKESEVVNTLKKKSAQHEAEEEKRYNQSEEGKLYNKWRKKNPNADEDDFGDYLVDLESKGKEVKTFDRRVNEYKKDLDAIQGKNYVTNLIGTSAITAFSMAPLAAVVAGAATKNGKAAVGAYLGTMGMMALTSLYSDRQDQKKARKKYGI